MGLERRKSHLRATTKEEGHEKHTIKYVGLDTHKDTIVIAITDEGRSGEIWDYGTISHTLNALEKFICR